MCIRDRKGGQYQVVIGNEVADVYDAVMGKLSLKETGTDSKPQTFMEKAVDIISGTFWPFLGVMCATGVIKGILGALSYLGILDAASGTYTILYAVADGFFYFLPVLIAITMSEKLKMDKFIAVTLALALVYPTIVNIAGGEVLGTLFAGNSILEMNYYIRFLGLPVIMPKAGYTSSVFPIMLALLVAARLEKWAKSVIPALVRSFLVPTIVLIIMAPLVFLFIGPVAYILANLVGSIFSAAFNIPVVGGAVGGLLIGGFWQVFVMLGLHFGLTPLAIVNLTSRGYDFLIAPNFVCSFATFACVLGVYLKTRSREKRSEYVPAMISALCGVTEPAVYGITLPRIKVFVISCIGGAVGGLIIGLKKCFLYMVGGMGIFGFTSFIDVNGVTPEHSAIYGMVWAIVASLISIAVSLVFTILFYRDDSEKAGASEQKLIKGAGEKLYAPLRGKKVSLKEVKDEVFSSGSMGPGIAIEPAEGKLYAPCDGIVKMLFPTGHAVGIESLYGTEILIHVGMDTVELEGKYFSPKVKAGDTCQKGQLLLEFDMEAIKATGRSLTTLVVITNGDEGLRLDFTEKADCDVNDVLVQIAMDREE